MYCVQPRAHVTPCIAHAIVQKKKHDRKHEGEESHQEKVKISAHVRSVRNSYFNVAVAKNEGKPENAPKLAQMFVRNSIGNIRETHIIYACAV